MQEAHGPRRERRRTHAALHCSRDSPRSGDARFVFAAAEALLHSVGERFYIKTVSCKVYANT